MVTATNKKKGRKYQGDERRKTKRRPILDTFSLSVVVSNKGVYRLPIQDLSEGGIGFDLDTDGESEASVPMKEGEKISLKVYLNRSLFIPIEGIVVRVRRKDDVLSAGAEFDKSDQGYEALRAFLQMLDELIDRAEIEANPAP